MNKTTIALALAIALCCATAALAQTPGAPPARGQDRAVLPSMPAEKDQTGPDARPGAMPQGPSTMGAGRRGMGMMSGMDANGDDVITKEEWDAHQARMWDRMNKNGTIAVQDMQKAMEEGGPN
ncbi:MAG: hypothetical protein ACXWC2_02525 [Ramlibacter sp.]